MEHNVIENKYYMVTATEETTVTDVKSGRILAIIPANTQQHVKALSNQFTTEGDCDVRPFGETPCYS